MNEVLAITLKSMHADMGALDQIAQNLANARTPAHKRGVAVQTPIGASFAALLGVSGSSAIDAAATATQQAPVSFSDMRPGIQRATDSPLDVALSGKGYFEVTTPAGPAYTRRGNFRLDAQGRLVTQRGDAVQGKGGDIFLNGVQPLISEAGVISNASDGRVVDQLKLVEFDGESRMTRLGDGLYAAGEAMKLQADADSHVRQGALENSNVDSAHEMTDLIAAMRHFESVQKAAQSYDDMLGTAIRKLGETS